MKKATKAVKALQKAGVDVGTGNDPMNFGSIFDSAIGKVAKHNDKDPTALDANRIAALVGIPLGHLALEMLFTESVLCLGRLMCFDGLPHTGKTGLLWEMCRIFDKANGRCAVVDTEKKQTDNFGPAIVGYDPWPRINFATADSLEEAYSVITFNLDGYKAKAKEVGKLLPVLMGMDSIIGAATIGEQENISKTGTSVIGFAHQANLAAKYLPAVIQKIAHLPVVFVAIRHLREVAAQYGKAYEPKGGGAWQFTANKTFRLSPDGPQIDKVTSGGIPIKIQLLKGTGEKMQIPVTMEWWDKPDEDGNNRRIIKWRWAEAALKLLSKPDAYHMPKRWQSAVKEVLGPINLTAGKTNCKPLGLSGANAEEFEQALYDPSNLPVLTAVRAALSIRVGHEYRGGEDFDAAKTFQRGVLLSKRDAAKPMAVEAVPKADAEEKPKPVKAIKAKAKK
jgi:hypothetical protein